MRALTVRQQQIVLTAIEQQLLYEPMTETRNRKPMRSNPLASWELRIANLRVYYDVVEEVDPPLQIVRIRAISVKERNKIFIGGEEVDL
ncbi:type II toxin-antitoxin system RelE/ParE family toxin [Microcoleus sp. FACHB-1515]|nr:type II toxin-antitoxin system RelE/ParE family toxin [Microcoleus sp. FACHB-1515]